jgi:DNA polymerase III sliding clamp (beta) subunit (PCNA family)
MPRVNREALLRALELLTPGLSTRETIAQSSCIAFRGDRAFTFNEEVLASVSSPLTGLNGAVKAKPLLDLLSKLDDSDLEIEQTGNELRLKGSGKRSSIRMEAEVLLPVEAVEPPGEWRKLDPEFCEGVNTVHPCAGTDNSKFQLTCIHIHPDFVEACDRFQVARFPVKTGVAGPILIRADSLRKILGCGMVEVSETTNWIHFRSEGGLQITLRRFLEDYPNLSEMLNSDGMKKITLPGALEEIVGRAEIFSGDVGAGNLVSVSISAEWIIIAGEGVSGKHEERKPVMYLGDPIKFQIPPKLLVAITKRSLECLVGERRLLVDSGKFIYCTCTMVPGTKVEADKKPKKTKGEAA